MKEKILFIAPANSIHSKKWIEAFLKFNYKIYWISFYEKSIEIDPKIDFFYLKKNIILNYFSLKKLLNKINPNIVHYHYLGFQLYLIPLLNIKKLITSPWGSDIKFTLKNSLKGIIIQKIFNKSSLITVDAKFMIDEVKKFDIKDNNKIKRINYGTNTETFNFKIKKRNKIFRIISLRNLEEIYALNDLINAVNNLLLKNHNIQLDIYGTGSLEKDLKKLVKNLKLDNNIKFKGKYIYEKLPSILKKYDLYVSTSTSDAGLSASTSEAMSSGTLVLSADNSENPFWMSDECGFLFSTKSVSDLTLNIEKIITLDNKTIKKYLLNARKKIEDYNDYFNEMSKMNKIYKKIID